MPEVQKNVKVKIPKIKHIGNSINILPYCYSINEYVKGKSINLIVDFINLNNFAFELAHILVSFKNIYFDDIQMMPCYNNFLGDHICNVMKVMFLNI